MTLIIPVFLRRFLMPRILMPTFLIGAIFLFSINTAMAIPLVRDEEIETHLRQWSLPIFNAAGLRSKDIRIYLVPSNDINAFVTNGQNIFIHTGLLLRANSPEEVIGVIAHETAHISGGHLARFDLVQKNAAYQQILSMLLGAGAALGGALAGSQDQAVQGGQAALLGGNHIARRRLLAEMRRFESSADEAALHYLDEIGLTSEGFLNFLKILEKRSKLYAGNIDPYTLTHPLSKERINHIRSHAERSPHTGRSADPETRENFDRMQAKLAGFLSPPSQTLRAYRGIDTIAGRYARAVAYHRSNKLEDARREALALIDLEKNNPYFQELLGQILFESGKLRQALPYLRQAHALAPDSALLLVSLARAEMEDDSGGKLEDAITHLHQALRIEPDNAPAWHFLAIAFGKKGQIGPAALAVAEHALLHGNLARARNQARRAAKLLPANSPQKRRAEDIIAIIKSR